MSSELPGMHPYRNHNGYCAHCNYQEHHPIHNSPLPDEPEEPGIYPKYVIFRHPKSVVDFFIGSVMYPGADHLQSLEEVDDFCFVLKPISDPHARVAMAAYAESCKSEKPQLAKDLYEILGDY